jgi:octaprenyl-diphosphate synthase
MTSPLDIIAADMRAVDDVIANRLVSKVPLVKDVAQYIISSGGKRLRPAMLLMCAGAVGNLHPHRHAMAAVVEFIHTATLLHDDVVDESISVGMQVYTYLDIYMYSCVWMSCKAALDAPSA